VIHWVTHTRQARIALQLGMSLAGVLLLTVPFWIWPIDLWIEGAAWRGPEEGWSLGERQPWSAIYHLGTWPALILVIGAVAVAIAGWRGGWGARWNKPAVYLILCMAVGPGLLVNLVLKDHWGRPRPRDVLPFGGDYAPEKVWIADPSSPGKSFPCGHCTMGFYFFAPALLLWRFGKRREATAVFAIALTGGLLLGIARNLQGGHFPSDVLWGGGICWLVSAGLFYVMRLDESLMWDFQLPTWIRRGPLQIGLAALSLAMLAGILLATPYRREDHHDLNPAPSSPQEISLMLTGNRHLISVAQAGVPGKILAHGQGHGLPGSGVKSTWTARREPGGQSYFQFKQRISGWFTELNHSNEVVVPDVAGEIRVTILSGDAVVDFRGISTAQDWKMEVAPGASCHWESGTEQGQVQPGEVFKRSWPDR